MKAHNFRMKNNYFARKTFGGKLFFWEDFNFEPENFYSGGRHFGDLWPVRLANHTYPVGTIGYEF